MPAYLEASFHICNCKILKSEKNLVDVRRPAAAASVRKALEGEQLCADIAAAAAEISAGELFSGEISSGEIFSGEILSGEISAGEIPLPAKREA